MCPRANLQPATAQRTPAETRKQILRVQVWRSLLTGDVAQARDGFRQLLSTPILCTPFVKNGRRGLRFEGRIGADALFGGVGN